jgi:hypothetical protein
MSGVIKRAVWLYFRFNLSLREVEEIPAERGIDVSYEAIWDWCRNFGLPIASNPKRRRPKHLCAHENGARISPPNRPDSLACRRSRMIRASDVPRPRRGHLRG